MRRAAASNRSSSDGWSTSIRTKTRSTKSSLCATTWIDLSEPDDCVLFFRLSQFLAFVSEVVDKDSGRLCLADVLCRDVELVRILIEAVSSAIDVRGRSFKFDFHGTLKDV